MPTEGQKTTVNRGGTRYVLQYQGGKWVNLGTELAYRGSTKTPSTTAGGDSAASSAERSRLLDINAQLRAQKGYTGAVPTASWTLDQIKAQNKTIRALVVVGNIPGTSAGTTYTSPADTVTAGSNLTAGIPDSYFASQLSATDPLWSTYTPAQQAEAISAARNALEGDDVTAVQRANQNGQFDLNQILPFILIGIVVVILFKQK